MRETLFGALSYTGVYHSHGLFLELPCARFLLTSGYRLLRGYAYLANRCLRESRKLFALRPKLHYFHHTLWDLQLQIDAGHAHILNYSGLFNCEANEDFIGRCSRISRRVSPRLAALRTVQRYLVACKLIYRRAGL